VNVWSEVGALKTLFDIRKIW